MAEHQFLNFMNGFITLAQDKITELAKTELENKAKKAKLDEAITTFIETTLLDKSALNFFVKLAIKKLVIPHIAELTQIVFDLLKARIEKVTEEPATTDNGKGQDGEDGQEGKKGQKTTKTKNGGSNK